MGIVVLFCYILAIFCLSHTGNRQASNQSFFINNRSTNTVGVGVSIIVSCVGASATIGMVGMAFTLGTPAFWWLGMGAVGLFCLGILLAKKVRRSCAMTMPQLVEHALGKPARTTVSVVIVCAWMAILAAQFSAMVQIVSALTGLQPLLCLAIAVVLVTGHTLSGGQATIMRLDSLQGVVLFAGLITIILWLTGHNPNWVDNTHFELVNEQFTAEKLLYYFFIIGGSYFVCPMLFGRLLSAKDAVTARRSAIFAAGGLCIAAVLIVSIGLACRGIVAAGTPADTVLVTALGAILPNWLNILILLVLLSAVVSSADSCLLTAGTVFAVDLLHTANVRTCRFCIVVLAGAGTAVTFMDKSILGFLLMSYDAYVCGVVVPVFIGLMLGSRFRFNPYFVCSAVLAGGALGAFSAFSEVNTWSFAGLAASAVLTLLGVRGKNESVE